MSAVVLMIACLVLNMSGYATVAALLPALHRSGS